MVSTEGGNFSNGSKKKYTLLGLEVDKNILRGKKAA